MLCLAETVRKVQCSTGSTLQVLSDAGAVHIFCCCLYLRLFLLEVTVKGGVNLLSAGGPLVRSRCKASARSTPARAILISTLSRGASNFEKGSAYHTRTRIIIDCAGLEQSEQAAALRRYFLRKGSSTHGTVIHSHFHRSLPLQSLVTQHLRAALHSVVTQTFVRLVTFRVFLSKVASRISKFSYVLSIFRPDDSISPPHSRASLRLDPWVPYNTITTADLCYRGPDHEHEHPNHVSAPPDAAAV